MTLTAVSEDGFLSDPPALAPSFFVPISVFDPSTVDVASSFSYARADLEVEPDITSRFKTFYRDPIDDTYLIAVANSEEKVVIDLEGEYMTLKQLEADGASVPDMALGTVSGVPALRLAFIDGTLIDLKNVSKNGISTARLFDVLSGQNAHAISEASYATPEPDMDLGRFSDEDIYRLYCQASCLFDGLSALSDASRVDDLQFIIQAKTGKPIVIDPLPVIANRSAECIRMTTKSYQRLDALRDAAFDLQEILTPYVS